MPGYKPGSFSEPSVEQSALGNVQQREIKTKFKRTRYLPQLKATLNSSAVAGVQDQPDLRDIRFSSFLKQ